METQTINTNTKLQALLFDVDGTLADTEKDGHRIAINKAFAETGLDWHWSVDLYGELLAITGGKERIKHFIQHYNPPFNQPHDLEQFITTLHQLKTKHYLDIVKSGQLPLRPGVKRLITEAHNAGLTLAIVTTTTPQNVSLLLECYFGAQALNWFAVIAAGDIVPHKKPAPDIYQYTLDALALSPQQCLAFEDSENGIRSAQSAHIPTLITMNDYTSNHDFTGAILTLDHLGEPDQPFTVYSGDSHSAHFVDVELLHTLHANSTT